MTAKALSRFLLDHLKRRARREPSRPDENQLPQGNRPGQEDASYSSEGLRQMVSAGRLRRDRLRHRMGALAALDESGRQAVDAIDDTSAIATRAHLDSEPLAVRPATPRGSPSSKECSQA